MLMNHFHRTRTLSTYTVILSTGEPDIYVLAHDDEEAAWEGKAVAKLFNCYLEDIIPHD